MEGRKPGQKLLAIWSTANYLLILAQFGTTVVRTTHGATTAMAYLGQSYLGQQVFLLRPVLFRPTGFPTKASPTWGGPTQARTHLGQDLTFPDFQTPKTLNT